MAESAELLAELLGRGMTKRGGQGRQGNPDGHQPNGDRLMERHASTAFLSPDGLYRYALGRRWADGWTLAFIMLNPSTADALADDPTIRRCVGFAKREGAGALAVGNAYAWRATNPADLAGVKASVGPDNLGHLREIGRVARTVVVAWGAHKMMTPHRVRQTMEALGRDDLAALGVTASGAPRHPLYVRGDAPLIPWARRG